MRSRCRTPDARELDELGHAALHEEAPAGSSKRLQRRAQPGADQVAVELDVGREQDALLGLAQLRDQAAVGTQAPTGCRRPRRCGAAGRDRRGPAPRAVRTRRPAERRRRRTAQAPGVPGPAARPPRRARATGRLGRGRRSGPRPTCRGRSCSVAPGEHQGQGWRFGGRCAAARERRQGGRATAARRPGHEQRVRHVRSAWTGATSASPMPNGSTNPCSAVRQALQQHRRRASCPARGAGTGQCWTVRSPSCASAACS